jgi:acyl-CoA dehydrogenase
MKPPHAGSVSQHRRKATDGVDDPVRQALIPPLQKIVNQRGLWATHLGPHLGGPGYGHVKLALLNEILTHYGAWCGCGMPDQGRSSIARTV